MAAARAQLSTLRYFPAASVDGNFFLSHCPLAGEAEACAGPWLMCFRAWRHRATGGPYLDAGNGQRSAARIFD